MSESEREGKKRLVLHLTFFFWNLLLTFLCNKGDDAGRDVLEHPGRNTREKGVTDTTPACMHPEDINYHDE
jgi:hypothetical protein